MKQKPSKPLPTAPAEAARPGGLRGFLRRSWLAICILAVCLGALAALLITANRGVPYYEGGREEGEYRSAEGTVRVSVERAEVVNISRDTVSPNPRNPDHRESGQQTLLVRMKTGTRKGETLPLSNDHFVGVYTSEKVRVGDEISVLQTENLTTGALELSMKNYDRTPMVWGVLGLFVLVVLLVGGRTGLKSLLGLILTVVALIWVFCPMWMKGTRPVPLAFGLCVLVTVLSFVILSGTGKKTLCAVLGTVAGMGLAAGFSLLAQALLRIDSYALYDAGTDFADLANLQQRGFDLHLEGLLTAGVIISALGAVMDVAMSLSSAIGELKTVNPELSRRDLLRSAMHIGRDMVGTMTNTLILAFVGSSLVLVIRLWSQGASSLSLTSSRYLSVELISAISSSIGVILAVPLTAVIGSALYGGKREGISEKINKKP